MLKNMKSLLSVSFVLVLAACAHDIKVEPAKLTGVTAQSPQEVALVISQDTRNFSRDKSRGTDTWHFPVGDVISKVTPQVFEKTFRSVEVVSGSTNSMNNASPIVKIEISSFEMQMGLFQWSEHEALVGFNVVVFDKAGKQIWSGNVTGKGNSSASSQASAYVPLAGVGAFDKALSAAINNAVTDASIKAAQAVVTAIDRPVN